MLTRRELERAIRECEESAQANYQNCEKLATFYTIYDHLYSTPTSKTTFSEEVIGDVGESEFLSSVTGKDARRVWMVIDELVDALKVTNPRLYDGVIRKIAGI